MNAAQRLRNATAVALIGCVLHFVANLSRQVTVQYLIEEM